MKCSLDVRHFPVFHLNINWFVFSCSAGIIEVRCTYLMYTSYSFDLRCESVIHIIIEMEIYELKVCFAIVVVTFLQYQCFVFIKHKQLVGARQLFSYYY